LSSGVASSAVGIEDLFSVVNVSGNSGLDGKSESDGTGGGGLKRDQTRFVRNGRSNMKQKVPMARYPTARGDPIISVPFQPIRKDIQSEFQSIQSQ
jgi:hypothetical protein